MIEMAGGTFEHAAIAANLISKITAKLEGKPCRALGSDLRVRISDFGHYCYPDVTIVCGPPIFDPPDKRTTIVNPQLVIEISSASTAADDRGDKFYDYMSIATLQDYLIVSQDRARVDTFYRQSDGIWAIGPSFEGLNAEVVFRSLQIPLALSEVYAGVVFPDPGGPNLT